MAVIVLVFAALASAMWFVMSQYHIGVFAVVSSDPAFLVYRVSRGRRLVLGRDVALLINKEERVVLSLSCVGHKWGPIVLWPRDEMRGVVLGDAVKGDSADTYRFDANGVDISYATSGRNNLRVPL